MRQLIEKLKEWHDARVAIFAVDMTKLPFEEHRPYWDRLGNAEHALMDEARKIEQFWYSDPPAYYWRTGRP